MGRIGVPILTWCITSPSCFNQSQELGLYSYGCPVSRMSAARRSCAGVFMLHFSFHCREALFGCHEGGLQRLFLQLKLGEQPLGFAVHLLTFRGPAEFFCLAGIPGEFEFKALNALLENLRTLNRPPLLPRDGYWIEPSGNWFASLTDIENVGAVVLAVLEFAEAEVLGVGVGLRVHIAMRIGLLVHWLPHLAVLEKGLGEFRQAGFGDFVGFVEGFVGDVFPLLDGVQDGVDFSGGFGFADLVNSTHVVCVVCVVALSHQGWVSRSSRRHKAVSI